MLRESASFLDSQLRAEEWATPDGTGESDGNLPALGAASPWLLQDRGRGAGLLGAEGRQGLLGARGVPAVMAGFQSMPGVRAHVCSCHLADQSRS